MIVQLYAYGTQHCIYAMLGLVTKIGMVKFVTLLHRNGSERIQHSIYTGPLGAIVFEKLVVLLDCEYSNFNLYYF
jgi:hypothetical protein